MIVSTTNEYGELRSVLVGSVDNFCWPIDDNEFNESVARSTYEIKFTNQPLSNQVIDEAKEDLQHLVNTLEGRGIEVLRPDTVTPTWAYSARDILLTIGNKVIECPTPFSSRSKELDLYPKLKQIDCDIIRAPRN